MYQRETQEHTDSQEPNHPYVTKEDDVYLR